MSQFDQQANQVLDQILAVRRSVRVFKPDIPPREDVDAVIRAGLLAPYSASPGSRDEFRRFVVVARDNPATAQLDTIVAKRASMMVEQMAKVMPSDDDSPRLGGKAFAGKLEMIAQHGSPLGSAPYYIVIAERRGMPPSQLQSIAHCLENMWLKATVLNMGMRLVTITEQMSDNPEFCQLLGIPAGMYQMDGCLLGYPIKPPTQAIRPAVSETTTWLD